MPVTVGSSPAAADVNDLAERLRPAILRLSRHLRREAQRVGVSALDAQLLGVIKTRPGLGLSALADIEQMTRPAMSAHVKRLEDAGWIERKAAEQGADQRRIGLVLTAEGRQALNAIRRTRNDWLAARLARLDEGERRRLVDGLDALGKLAEAGA